MPDIETLDVLTINYNAIDMQTQTSPQRSHCQWYISKTNLLKRWVIIILDHIHMPVWKIQIQTTAIHSSTIKWPVSEENRWNVQGVAKCVWNCWRHISYRLWWQWLGLWHVTQSTMNMQWCKSKTKHRYILFQMLMCPKFGDIISRHVMKPNPRKLKALVEMPLQVQKGTASIPWNN